MAGSMGGLCALLFAAVVFCCAGESCYADEQSDMKASFNLEHNSDTAIVSLRPSVYAKQSATVDYRIKVSKQGAAGTSSEGHGGRVDLLAGKDVELGPQLSFGSFAREDRLQVVLRLCRMGSRCKQPEDLLASFTLSYPDTDGAEQ